MRKRPSHSTKPYDDGAPSRGQEVCRASGEECLSSLVRDAIVKGASGLCLFHWVHHSPSMHQQVVVYVRIADGSDYLNSRAARTRCDGGRPCASVSRSLLLGVHVEPNDVDQRMTDKVIVSKP